MTKVNNKKAISNLAQSGIKSNIKKYIVLVFAVILTTILFSSLFTVGTSLVNEIQRATMRQVGGSAHAGLKYLTEQEYNLVKNDKQIKDISYRILVGNCEGEAFKKLYNEVNYYEPLNAKYGFCYPEVGNMPEKENEIVLSDIILKKLGVPIQLGSIVPLSIKIGEKLVEQDFVLSGYFQGDIISKAQMVLVSKAFQEKHAPVKTVSLPELERNDYVGWVMADVNYWNSYDIEGKTKDLIMRSGLRPTVDYGVNWAYLSGGIDPTMLVLCIILLLVFMVAGYLIIYNIFDLNILSDIQEYGLLKTIGTTGKQLKKIVMKRANIISAIGIPIGLIIGVGVGACLLPMISEQLYTSSVDKGKVHVNILMILGASLFSYLTVIISAQKPCKKASKVSPIETIKYTEPQTKNGKPKKKLLTVVLSLSLSLVVLNSVITIVHSFSMDKLVENLVISDYSVQNAELDNPGVTVVDTQGVNQQFLDALNMQDGVDAVGNVYMNFGVQEINEENWGKIRQNLFTSEEFTTKAKRYSSYSSQFSDIDDYIEYLGQNRLIDGNTYGMGKLAVEKLDFVKTLDGTDKIDWDAFNSGDYVLATRFFSDKGQPINFFEPGDKVEVRGANQEYTTYLFMKLYSYAQTVTFEDQSDTQDFSAATEEVMADAQDMMPVLPEITEIPPLKEYTVFAVVDIPTPMAFGHYSLFQCDFILPEREFLAISEEWKPMRTLIDVNDENEDAFEQWIKSYTNVVDTSLDYSSKGKTENEYKSFATMVGIIGTVISVILGLIGVINFSNTIVTSIIARSRELAMLEAVGMTGKQQTKRLMKEGFVYFIWTFAVSVVFASVLSCTVVRLLVNSLFMFSWKFSLTPLFVCSPVICALVLVIPVAAHKVMRKKSVVERLREE
ncbi:MAG: FtsX-like permease family protein [Treponemataceae bacterium]|nr:FtsX-like permease family protein [Treponemataceae bacterium]